MEDAEIKDKLAAAPPYDAAKASKFPKALDGAWKFVGTMAIPSGTTRYFIPHSHTQFYNSYSFLDIPSAKNGLCRIEMFPVNEDIWVGLCKEYGMMFWMKVKYVS